MSDYEINKLYRHKAHIAQYESPLRTARIELDIAYMQQAQEVSALLTGGASIDLVMDLYDEEPLPPGFESLLEAGPTENDGWNDLYGLHMTLASRKLRLFSKHVFSPEGTMAQRRDLCGSAYISAGKLLADAFRKIRRKQTPERWGELRGAISELTVFGQSHALPYAAGTAVLGTSVDDKNKIDFNFISINNEGNCFKSPLQVKTASDSGEKDLDESRVVKIVANDFFASESSSFHAARLIVRDVDGNSTLEERVDISLRAQALQQYIIYKRRQQTTAVRIKRLETVRSQAEPQVC